MPKSGHAPKHHSRLTLVTEPLHRVMNYNEAVDALRTPTTNPRKTYKLRL
ncbi:MAG TPA: hypothetical protein VF201_13760 [Nitrolancea sp.]